MTNAVLEALADTAHRVWSDWIHFLFAKRLLKNTPDSKNYPVLAQTHYRNLSEKAKESDRRVARRYIEALKRAWVDELDDFLVTFIIEDMEIWQDTYKNTPYRFNKDMEFMLAWREKLEE